MAYFLFVDESGTDGRESPYMVLGGVAVRDSALWSLVVELQKLEFRLFGGRYHHSGDEIKGRKFLSSKTFKKARFRQPLAEAERRRLAAACLASGAERPEGITALAQAKLAYVSQALDICIRHKCHAFASLVDRDSPAPIEGHLRKDYNYLIERFFYFLEDQGEDQTGILVFDELEKQQSRNLIETMEAYFRNVKRGSDRAARIVPQPFFVHSDLTTGVQLADLVCYILNWGFRLPSMVTPGRQDLKDYANLVAQLRYKAVRPKPANPGFAVWSIAHIPDLRSLEERGGAGK